MICSNGGGEFIGHSRAERANQTIVESMRATLNGSGIPKRFWHEILKSCCLGLNQLPRKGNTSSPWELLHGKTFPTNFLQSVGTPVVVLNMTGTKGRKFDSKGEEGRLIGFKVSLLLYRVISQSGRIVESKHVQFLKRDDTEIKVDVDNEIQFLPEDNQKVQELVPPVIESTPADHHGRTILFVMTPQNPMKLWQMN
ncbi:gag/pol polyprotein [Puccinia sorghi]|uniref:Gag/pol polyprotein n=1 Tax=Puccinia sorghi TaxID=27349 RepID=A0A0L6VS80_9BASI|nr:gag/pol polyprotein [Puccinia sorghi]